LNILLAKGLLESGSISLSSFVENPFFKLLFEKFHFLLPSSQQLLQSLIMQKILASYSEKSLEELVQSKGLTLCVDRWDMENEETFLLGCSSPSVIPSCFTNSVYYIFYAVDNGDNGDFIRVNKKSKYFLGVCDVPRELEEETGTLGGREKVVVDLLFKKLDIMFKSKALNHQQFYAFLSPYYPRYSVLSSASTSPTVSSSSENAMKLFSSYIKQNSDHRLQQFFCLKQWLHSFLFQVINTSELFKQTFTANYEIMKFIHRSQSSLSSVKRQRLLPNHVFSNAVYNLCETIGKIDSYFMLFLVSSYFILCRS
jgi:hypothetical protein